MQLTLKSSSPYVAVDGAGTASIQYSTINRRFRWSDYSTLISVSASLSTDPFKACAYGSLAGKSIGGCVP
jgi:hypothetical protein